MSTKEDFYSATRAKIQNAMEHAEQEHLQKFTRHRIEIVKSAVKAYELNKHADAVQFYKFYLRIVEDWKGVGTGGLHPSLFSLQDDLPELLLISGVYWDLAKLFDRTETAERHREFMHYLEKYILFSKGMPYQVLTAETLRKYLGSSKPIHKSQFKHAYKMIKGGGCFVATSLSDLIAPDTLPRLRAYRDGRLSQSAIGRWFIEFYYEVGPALADFTDHLPHAVRKRISRVLDSIAQRLG